MVSDENGLPEGSAYNLDAGVSTNIRGGPPSGSIGTIRQSGDIVPGTMSQTLGSTPQSSERKARSMALAGLVGIIVLGTATAAKADGDFLDNLKLEVGVMGGVHIFAKDLELGVADDPGLTTPKNGGLFGLRIGVVLHPMFTFEFEGALIPTSDRQFDYRAWLTAERVQLRFDPFKLADGKLQPFILAGIGGLTVLSTEGTAYNELKKDTDFVYHFGVGTKYALNDLVHLRLDARFLEVPNTSKNGVSPDWEFMGGVGFTFGGAPPAPPPATPR